MPGKIYSRRKTLFVLDQVKVRKLKLTPFADNIQISSDLASLLNSFVSKAEAKGFTIKAVVSRVKQEESQGNRCISSSETPRQPDRNEY